MGWLADRLKPRPNHTRMGTHLIEEDDLVLLDGPELSRRIVEEFSAPTYRPPALPAAAVELMSLSQQPGVSIDQVITVLERDPVLAGQVLKLAQSAHYSPAGPTAVRSLRQAVMRVGLDTLRNIVMEVALNLRVFKAGAFTDEMQRLARHSAATAHLAARVARETSVPAEFCFLCGLFHDVGVAGGLLLVADVMRKHDPSELMTIGPALDQAHERLSAIMARLWQLPDEIQIVVGNHHHVEIGGEVHPVAALVCIAEELAIGAGAGITADEGSTLSGRRTDRSGRHALQQAYAALSLGAGDRDRLQRMAREVIDGLD